MPVHACPCHAAAREAASRVSRCHSVSRRGAVACAAGWRRARRTKVGVRVEVVVCAGEVVHARAARRARGRRPRAVRRHAVLRVRPHRDVCVCVWRCGGDRVSTCAAGQGAQTGWPPRGRRAPLTAIARVASATWPRHGRDMAASRAVDDPFQLLLHAPRPRLPGLFSSGSPRTPQASSSGSPRTPSPGPLPWSRPPRFAYAPWHARAARPAPVLGDMCLVGGSAFRPPVVCTTWPGRTHTSTREQPHAAANVTRERVAPKQQSVCGRVGREPGGRIKRRRGSENLGSETLVSDGSRLRGADVWELRQSFFRFSDALLRLTVCRQ